MYATNEGDGSQQLRSSMFSLSGTGFVGAIGRSINLGKRQLLIIHAQTSISLL